MKGRWTLKRVKVTQDSKVVGVVNSIEDAEVVDDVEIDIVDNGIDRVAEMTLPTPEYIKLIPPNDELPWQRLKAGINHTLGRVGSILHDPMHRVADNRERRAIWAARYNIQSAVGHNEWKWKGKLWQEEEGTEVKSL